MNPSSFRSLKPSYRWLAAALCCLPLGNACNSDDSGATTPPTFGIEIATLDGGAPEQNIQVRCERGGPRDQADDASAAGAAAVGAPIAETGDGFFSTLSVAISLTSSDPGQPFVLRPAHACGASTRCGFVRIEGLAEDGHVLSSVDTATTEGVLRLNPAQLPHDIRASLVRGLDQRALQNPDGTAVAAVLRTTFTAVECIDLPSGAGGAGAGGASAVGEGGSRGDDVGGAPAGGAGGSTSDGAAGNESGGAGGDSSIPSLAGAGGALNDGAGGAP